MRRLLFLLPGTTQAFFAGGLTAELKTLRLAQHICPAAVVTYRQREPETLFLPDLLSQGRDEHSIFVVSWGFDVPRLVRQLGDRPTLYHAHSTGYGFSLPARIPIITVSRNSMGYWGQQALGSLIYYLPNEIDPAFENRQQPRDIDVLVQARKSSHYLLRQLVPALEPHCKVVIIDRYVDDLVALFNRAKVYLYDSAEYWGRYRLTEGFGLPPMEALACGTQVFSSVNHALADYLDPGFNCQKISGYDTGYDCQRILQAVADWPSYPCLPPDFFAPYRSEQLRPRLQTILTEINSFFDYQQAHPVSDIPTLTPQRRVALTLERVMNKLKAFVTK